MSAVQFVQLVVLAILLLVLWSTKKALDAKIKAASETLASKVAERLEEKEKERNQRVDLALARIERALKRIEAPHRADDADK